MLWIFVCILAGLMHDTFTGTLPVILY